MTSQEPPRGNWGSVRPQAEGSPPPPPPPPLPLHPPTQPPAVSDPSNDLALRMLLPVGRSGVAIAAGYMGLLSVIPIFAPIAIILGLVAVRHLKRNPKERGMGRAVFAIVMGSIFCLLYLAILIANVVTGT